MVSRDRDSVVSLSQSLCFGWRKEKGFCNRDCLSCSGAKFRSFVFPVENVASEVVFIHLYTFFFLYTNYQIMNSYISKWNTVGNTIEIDTNATKTSLFFVSASLFLLHPSIMSVLRHASALSGGRQSAGNPCHALPGQLSFQRASYTSAEWRQPQAALGSFHQRCVHNCVRFKVELHSA